MPKTTKKPQPIVTLRIERRTTTPAARQNWKKWWAARIAECQAEFKAENKAKHEQ